MTLRSTITVILAFLAVLALATSPAGAIGRKAIPKASDADLGPFTVDKDDFEGRKLVWSYFRALSERDDIMVIDVRSGFLPADGDPPGLINVRPVPLEIFLINFVDRKVHQDKTLLIFDHSGVELRRLQFHLQKNGYDNYFFLEGGAESAQNLEAGRS